MNGSLRWMGQAALVTTGLVALTACPPFRKMNPEEICEEVSRAVGLRISECSEEELDISTLSDAFLASQVCTPPEGEQLGLAPFECVGAIREITCDQVLAHGQDWDAWVQVSPVCEALFSPAPTTDTAVSTGGLPTWTQPGTVPQPTQTTPLPATGETADTGTPPTPTASTAATAATGDTGDSATTPTPYDINPYALKAASGGQVSLLAPPDLGLGSRNTLTIELFVKSTGPVSGALTLLGHVPPKILQPQLQVLYNLDASNCAVGGATFTPGALSLFLRTSDGFTIAAASGMPPALDDGAWHHVAFAVDDANTPGGFRLYVDGVAQSVLHQCNADLGTDAFGGTLEMLSQGVPYYGAEVLVDDLRIWSSARAEKDVLATANQPLPAKLWADPSLQAYLAFDELVDLGQNGDGADDVEDLSGHGAHADLEGAAALALDTPQ